MALDHQEHPTDDLTTDSRLAAPTRLEAVERDCFVDGALRSDLGWVAGVAQRALRSEIALLSVLDTRRQHFLSQRGLAPAMTGTPLSQSLCRIVVERDAPLVVHDATEHRLLAAHPAVTELGVASYAGVPVRSPDGPVLGALCVLGRSPRTWSAQDLGDLETIAAVVRDTIDLAARRAADGDAVAAVTGTADPAGSRIRAALAAGCFELHYQPVVELASGRTHAYEALLRWNDPVRGMLPPAAFLAAAESSGAMPELTRFVVRAACRQLAGWAARGFPTSVAINASREEILSPEFVPLVRAELDAAGVARGSLIVEMTEQLAATAPERLAETVTALRAAGVRLALDDFGTEHSSLSRLRESSIDILKIDRRFMDGIPADPKACAILEVLLGLGRAVEAEVVCGGIETDEQRRHARDHGCRYGQGWLFARPAPADGGAPPGWSAPA
ncbi:MAG: diguanylate cyclase/phosphodiesterase [Solirubrobacterales bacterium]|nr:diguanylate cyclase/phosphodiesterase [Solirubrobacterales bacterium]